jgi:hypothetical protein
MLTPVYKIRLILYTDERAAGQVVDEQSRANFRIDMAVARGRREEIASFVERQPCRSMTTHPFCEIAVLTTLGNNGAGLS